MDETSPLDSLKKQYEELKQKYNLPEFSELNEVFDIEEVDPETDFLLRKIRRTMSEKISGYLRFVEILLNPSNAPIFFFKLIKKLDGSDKENIASIYEKLGKFEIQIISLDLEYSEEKEVEFINNMYKAFNDKIKKDFLAIIEKLKNGKENSKKTNGSYFG